MPEAVREGARSLEPQTPERYDIPIEIGAMQDPSRLEMHNYDAGAFEFAEACTLEGAPNPGQAVLLGRLEAARDAQLRLEATDKAHERIDHMAAKLPAPGGMGQSAADMVHALQYIRDGDVFQALLAASTVRTGYRKVGAKLAAKNRALHIPDTSDQTWESILRKAVTTKAEDLSAEAHGIRLDAHYLNISELLVHPLADMKAVARRFITAMQELGLIVRVHNVGVRRPKGNP